MLFLMPWHIDKHTSLNEPEKTINVKDVQLYARCCNEMGPDYSSVEVTSLAD